MHLLEHTLLALSHAPTSSDEEIKKLKDCLHFLANYSAYNVKPINDTDTEFSSVTNDKDLLNYIEQIGSNLNGKD